MEDFRMKLQNETQKISDKVKKGESLSQEELKLLFLNSYLAEESNE